MAESIYKLFDYQAPENIRAAYLDNLLVSPDRMAGMDLYSQLAATGTNVGGLLGASLGRMAGYVPAGEAKAQAIDQIMSEAAKGSSPLAQATRAYELFSANGMGREAQIAMERVEELTKETSKQQAKDALSSALGTLDPSKPEDQLKLATLAAQAEQGTLAGSAFTTAGVLKKEQEADRKRTQKNINQTRAVKAINPDVADDIAEVIGSEDATFGKFLEATLLAKKEGNKTQTVTVDDKVKLITITPSTGEIVREQVLGSAAKPAKTEVKVTLDQRGQGKYADTVGTETAKEDVAFVNTVEKASETLPKINETLKLLNEGDVTTGIGAELLLNVNRVRSQFLKDKKAGKAVTDTQVLDAMLGSEVFPMIDALGIGARGLDTPAEREYLRDVFTGTIKMEKETLIELTKIRKNIAERALQKFNQRLGEGYFDVYQEALGRKMKPYDIPTTNGSPTTAKGTKYKILGE